MRPRMPTQEEEALVTAFDRAIMAAEKRGQRQIEWFSAFTHDAKTPLAASANALASLPRGTDGLSQANAEVIIAVSRDLRSLARSMQKVIDVVRFDQDDLPLEVGEFNVRDVVGDLVARLPPESRTIVSVDGEAVFVGDEALIVRAVENLVANAVRYARSRVEVSIHPGVVRVADDGPGLVAPLEVLAEPFRSSLISIGETQISGGAAGIGLYVASRVLELHGGRLVVESTGSAGTALLAYLGGRR